MANDPRVNITETMAASRHSSVSASAVYQKRSATRESNRIDERIQTPYLDQKMPPVPKRAPKEEEDTYPTPSHTLSNSSPQSGYESDSNFSHTTFP
mmetsp:Transcript_11330/g.13383  ORF Transcript_11330/g.13383 Transcript_11330/m.13383 type:complete len:96 (-) Transcript_11330:94-381(-)